jgi:hypothetical protein
LFRGQAGEGIPQLAHCFGERRAQGVVAARGENVRPGRDQVNMHGERRAGFRPAFEPNVGFVDLTGFAEREDLVLDPAIQTVARAKIQVSQVDSHGFNHGLNLFSTQSVPGSVWLFAPLHPKREAPVFTVQDAPEWRRNQYDVPNGHFG